MPTPGEHKTVQARILAYAEAIGWTVVCREEGERRRGIAAMTNGEFRMTNASLFFGALLHAKVREFNPRYAVAEGALPGQFPPSRFSFGATGRHFSSDIYGNLPPPRLRRTGREFVEHLAQPGQVLRPRREARA
ncbi:MAG: hypothetical protein KDK99_14125 [Verrucomicrobiales bacterium]|nr:hypothetical protein [Verrucomicrobiales bacterium]